MSARRRRGRKALLPLIGISLAVALQTADAQEATSEGVPARCAAAVAAEPPPDSSPLGHTLNVDEAHAGLFIASSVLRAHLAGAASIKEIDIAFLCGEIGLLQSAIDTIEVEQRFGRDSAVEQLAARQSAVLRAERAMLITELETRAP